MTTTARPRVPNNSGDLIAFLRDTNQMAALFAGNPEAFNTFATDYAKGFGKSDPHFETKVAEERQRVMATMLRENGDGHVPVNLGPSPAARVVTRHGLYSRGAEGAQIDGVFDTAGEYFAAISPKANPSDERLQGKLAKVRNASSTVPSEGGFLVPETLRSEIIFESLESAVVRPRATIIPMSTLRVPIPTVDDQSHASSVFGGVTAYWTEEGAFLTQSQGAFARVVLDAKKLTAYTEAPNELVADAPAFGAFIQQAMPAAVAWYEDSAFIQGTGVGEPLGMLNSSAAISLTRTAGGATVEFLDIINMYARMLPGSLNRAVWVCSPAVIPALLSLVLTVAVGDSVSPPLWLTGGSLAPGAPMSFLGRPLIVSEHVPNVGTSGDISFMDFGHYLIGDRQAMTSEASIHFKFQQDLTAYRVIERVDGRPWIQSAITPQNGGPTLSPVVKLTT